MSHYQYLEPKSRPRALVYTMSPYLNHESFSMPHVQGILEVPKGPRYPKVTKISKVSKKYLKVQDIVKVPNGPSYQKVT